MAALFLTSNCVKKVLYAFFNPTIETITALKLSSGLKLDAHEIELALKSAQTNPIKNWLTDIIFCYLKMICHHQEVLAQLFINQRKEEEYEAFLDDLARSDHDKKILALPLDLNYQAIPALLNDAIKSEQDYCYLHLQSAKVDELLFWSALITDENQLAKINQAVDDRYHWLMIGANEIEKTETEITREEIPEKIKEIKLEKIQSYKDHLRLSSTEYLIKIIPEVINNPDRAIHVAQTRVTIEQLFVNNLTSFRKSLNELSIDKKMHRAEPISRVVFFNLSSHEQQNKFDYLRVKLDYILNKTMELHENLDHPIVHDLYHLVGLLTAHNKQRNSELEQTILLKVQNNMDQLIFKQDYHDLYRCLKNWLNPIPVDIKPDEQQDQTAFRPNLKT